MPATTPIAEREAALVARWGAGELTGRWLRTVAGDDLAVLFPGRPGGPSGPDFRDAVLLRRDGARLYGDVEVHLRAGGWHAHGHDRDARYDGVVLHVVARAEGVLATPLASGRWASVVEIASAPTACANADGVNVASSVASWPCHDLAARHGASGVRTLLAAAGDARFEAHAFQLGERLAAAGGATRGERDVLPTAVPRWTAADRVFFAALAEGLAYGRDREPLRQAGAWLAAGGAPDALARQLPRLPVLNATRLEGLLALYARWEVAGPWSALRPILSATFELDTTIRNLMAALSAPSGAVSPGRAAILLANVVLPLAAAWADHTGDTDLAARSRALYAALGGLPANQITRAMARQLGLRRQPAGARAQQGLHHLWAAWCREKQCARCPCAR